MNFHFCSIYSYVINFIINNINDVMIGNFIEHINIVLNFEWYFLVIVDSKFCAQPSQMSVAIAHICVLKQRNRSIQKARIQHFHSTTYAHNQISQTRKINEPIGKERKQKQKQTSIYPLNELFSSTDCVWNEFLDLKKLDLLSSPVRFIVEKSHQTCITKSKRNKFTKKSWLETKCVFASNQREICIYCQ